MFAARFGRLAAYVAVGVLAAASGLAVDLAVHGESRLIGYGTATMAAIVVGATLLLAWWHPSRGPGQHRSTPPSLDTE